MPRGAKFIWSTLLKSYAVSSAVSAAIEDGNRMAGKLVVYPEYQIASFDGAPLPLTRSEYHILELLVENTGHVVSRKMFFLRLYHDRPLMPQPKILEVFICKLRRKIADATGGRYCIATVLGRGYVLTGPEDKEGPQGRGSSDTPGSP